MNPLETHAAVLEPRRSDPSPSSLIAELARYDTPTICNAIELFETRSASAGHMDGRIRCWFKNLPPMVGFACTATYRSAEPPHAVNGDSSACASTEVAHLVESFAKVPGPAVVVFQDLDDPPTAACFGDIACNTYKGFGAAGLVTSGAGRDLQQVADLNFPVFARSAMASHGYGHLTSVSQPVRVGGLTIRHGDLIHGDQNGVVSIPNDIAHRVPAVAERLVEAEKPVIEYLGRPKRLTLDGYRAVIKQMQDELESISADARKR